MRNVLLKYEYYIMYVCHFISQNLYYPFLYNILDEATASECSSPLLISKCKI